MEAPVINESTFSSANPSSYSLSEIWPITTTTHHFDSDADHSTLTHHHHHHHRTPNHNTKRKDSSSTTTPNHLNDCSGNKHIKLGGSSEENNGGDASSVAGNKLGQQGAKSNNNKPSEAPKQDYIHVRARRGQATDSHSLAERARREKISERMKILQDLVPGCNKVIGKALVLDEIINYIQSLQRQVEFLSMKLEAVNSRFNISPTVECFPSKDVGTQPFDLAGMIFGSQATRGYVEGSQPGWLHMQLGGGFERAT